jgi:hypothetical protein
MVDSNSIEIKFAIFSQRLFPTRVYPIPVNKLDAYTPIKLGLNIEHNYLNDFNLNPLQPFIPELLTSDGQIIQGYLINDETNEGNQKIQFNWRIRPKMSYSLFLSARLYWQNNSLKLKIPTIPHYYFSSSVNNSSFWCFDGLEVKNYKLRFLINTNIEINPWQNSSEILATPWLNLHLVQPLSNDSNAIEVDGVLFHMETPESIYWMTPPKPNIIKRIFSIVEQRYVNLGIRITNNTPNPLRFYQSGSIDVILRSEDGKEINRGGDPMRLGERARNLQSYYLVEPGKDAFINLQGIISWNKGHLQLAIPNKYCNYLTGKEAYYYFYGLKLGASYQLQVMYHIVEPQEEWYVKHAVSEKAWSGYINMPCVEFRLV